MRSHSLYIPIPSRSFQFHLILVPFLVVVRYFDVFRTFRPAKADAVLIVDSDTELTFAVAFESFQTIPGRRPPVFQFLRGVDPV